MAEYRTQDGAIARLLQQAAQAQQAGRIDEAEAGLSAVLSREPANPAALNSLGLIRLNAARPAEAEALFRRAVAADPQAQPLWINLASAQRAQGDDAGEHASLTAALAIDQRHLMALIRIADLHERRGEQAGALARWRMVLAAGQMVAQRSPALDNVLAKAQAIVGAADAKLAAAIDAGLADARAAVPAAERRRVDACIDHATGRRRIYVNECAGVHVPFLPADEFFPRHHFPWLSEVEAATATIRSELEAILAEDAGLFEPYVAMDAGVPENKWTALDGKLDWSALHLWRHGGRIEAACARAPRTAALLEGLPRADVPGRMPTAFFSILKPRTRLPAHTGVSNMRAIIHLPLIVPAGCGFRVGGETREWRVGEAFAFDDTIEHEAWNDSDHLRAVLIFDTWNPHLTAAERRLLADYFRVADESGAELGIRAAVSDD